MALTHKKISSARRTDDATHVRQAYIIRSFCIRVDTRTALQCHALENTEVFHRVRLNNYRSDDYNEERVEANERFSRSV